MLDWLVGSYVDEERVDLHEFAWAYSLALLWQAAGVALLGSKAYALAAGLRRRRGTGTMALRLTR